jgi:stalled ribosome rescue protein Dom34
MTSHHSHAVIWIDHREARVFHFSVDDIERLVIHANNPTLHIHHKANTVGSGNAPDDVRYFEDVAASIGDARAVLLTGPGVEKDKFIKYFRAHSPQGAKAIAGVETVDHPSDPQLVAFARKYFGTADLMKPQIK